MLDSSLPEPNPASLAFLVLKKGFTSFPVGPEKTWPQAAAPPQSPFTLTRKTAVFAHNGRELLERTRRGSTSIEQGKAEQSQPGSQTKSCQRQTKS